MKALIYGVLTFIVGFILTAILANVFSSGSPDNSYRALIGMTILFFASVNITCTFLLLTQLKCDKNTNE